MAISPPLLRAENLTLTFGGKPLFDDVSFSVHAGDRIALVGRNGSGKSTLLKIAAGHRRVAAGEISVTERDATSAICRRIRTCPASTRWAPMPRPGWARSTIRSAPTYLLEHWG